MSRDKGKSIVNDPTEFCIKVIIGSGLDRSWELNGLGWISPPLVLEQPSTQTQPARVSSQPIKLKPIEKNIGPKPIRVWKPRYE